MIDQNNLREEPTSIFPDLSLCDIDIDFELNDGKGAWVVVLRKNDHSRLLLPDIDE